MTQVQTMTDSELNRALAELMGWRFVGTFPNGFWKNPLDFPQNEPNYCGYDPISREVEAKAIEVDAREYVRNLQELKWQCSFSGISMKKAAELLTASPRERAEAAYITLSSKQ